MDRTNYPSGSPWEDTIGYSRAVRVGNTIEVTGTVADDQGNLVGGDNAYEQARFAFQKIQGILAQAGARLEDVVRTRMFVTDIERDWEAVGKAHQEFFGDIKPATTMIEVSRFIRPEYLVEIEATAIINKQ